MMERSALTRAVAAAENSPFLLHMLQRDPDVADRLAADGLADELDRLAGMAAADPDDARALRRQRAGVALAVALADLAGTPLEAVVAALTAFADQALDRAIRAAVAARVPGAEPDGFAALALGKQGSRELNYSSDIDPILLFDPARLPRRPRDEPGEAAVRIAREVVALLGQRTADGYVLRVDLRLRPAAEATPLAVPIELALTHYESSALPWERAAFIRARAAAGDRAMGDGVLQAIRPFVWRRGLDYGVLGELRALSRRIRDQAGAHPGLDLKRAPGGIREIEFFTQIHQLVHGGRDPALRAPATLDALAALAQAGVVAPEAAATLAATYRLLRTVEHRVQMMHDRQTHRLPDAPDEREAVARLAGWPSGAALAAELAAAMAATAALYDGLEHALSTPAAGAASPAALPFTGFADPAAAAARVDRWRRGEARTTRSQAARRALEAALPDLLAAFARAPSPDLALDRLDALVGRLPSAVNLFRLLEARPVLGEQLAAILSHAPALADQLTRAATLLDGLIDRRALVPPPDVPALVAEFGRAEAGDDYQRLLDRVRVTVGERRFQLGAQLVTGITPPLVAGAGYARVAEAALAVLADATGAEFARAHGQVPGGELVILALGRLGGGVLTHASDLDLVFLFTGDFLAESDGPRPLGATQYFNRLASRIVAALSVATAAGPLYPVDTRLRPSGAQGLLAVSVDSFARYQREDAWTWEHMALTRARPVFGSPAARAAVATVVAGVLATPRDPVVVRADVARMRGEIARHKPAAGPLDVKLLPGGLVDAEFAIQLLQLATGIGLVPDLAEAAGLLADAGRLAPGLAAAVDRLTAMLVLLRLVAPDGAAPAPASRALVARSLGLDDWPALLATLAADRALVTAEWRRVAGLD